jgi:hypothetical protein
LTFNTTFILIERLRERGFVEYESPRPRVDRKRRIFVAPKIAALLNGDGAIDAMFPSVEAERVLSTFVAGYLVTLSRKGAKSDLEQLIGLDEVWALCFRKPRPGWRLFGRFVAQDVLVLTKAYDRHELGGKTNYHRLAEAVIAEWESCFSGIPPYRASEVTGYLTGGVRNVDED